MLTLSSLSLSFLFLSFSLYLILSAILVLTSVRVVASFSPLLSPFLFLSLLINVSFYFSLSCSSLRLYFGLFAYISFSFLFLFRAHLYLASSTRFAPLVVLSCILFLFSQFRSSSRSFSSLFRSRCLFSPLLFSSSISFFSFRALFPSHPHPVARSAGIRGIFEPVHDGRLLQGRTFLQPHSEIFGPKGLIEKIKSVRAFKLFDDGYIKYISTLENYSGL